MIFAKEQSINNPYNWSEIIDMLKKVLSSLNATFNFDIWHINSASNFITL